MAQYLAQTISQQMRMEQRLTPQLIQSMAILQKPVTDLEAFIADALERNPALDIAEPDAPAADANGQAASAREAPRSEGSDQFSRLESFSRTYGDDLGYDDERAPRRPALTGERDAKMDAMANTAGREQSLDTYLREQWRMLDIADAEVRRAGELIIDHIDPDGYLRIRLEELADKARPLLDVGRLREALTLVQTLDPPGVGARDLVECLLLQLDQLPGDNRIERVLIESHLDDIAHNRLPQVAKATGYAVGEISEAIKAMRVLSMHPGYQIGNHDVPVIRPDVIVEYAPTGGGLMVRLARGNMPALAIREDVAEMARSRDNGKETREFARRQLEEASAIIDAVNFRGSRLLEVGRRVIEHQREFFNSGPEALRVLRMSDLADEMQCDPSTISRTVSDKYIQSPRGIFPLRYFFTGGTETSDGESTSWDSVKLRVKQLVDAEDKREPLTDDEIAKRLLGEGVEISRRTVAKYRQQLEIPSTRQRKEYVG